KKDVVGFLRYLFALLLTAVVCPVVQGQTAEPTPSAQSSSSSKAKPQTNKKSSASAAGVRKKTTRSAKSRRSSPRFHRMHQAFVASTTLKPMAQQLLQSRTPAAYAGVEAFARKHTAEDAGALAWLAVGYAHFLDHDCAKAIDPLNRAKPHAGDIGDYVAFYLANCYIQTGRTSEAIAALSAFEKNYPASLLVRDARVLHANALLTDNRPKEAVALLEDDRIPARADLELALGRAYEAAGDKVKAAAVLGHLYFTIPLSLEASVAQVELQKLATTPGIVPPTFGARKNHAD